MKYIEEKIIRTIKKIRGEKNNSENRRGWQAKEEDIAAIAQETGNIIDALQKATYCRQCQNKKKPRVENKIPDLSFIEWFINMTII